MCIISLSYYVALSAKDSVPAKKGLDPLLEQRLNEGKLTTNDYLELYKLNTSQCATKGHAKKCDNPNCFKGLGYRKQGKFYT